MKKKEQFIDDFFRSGLGEYSETPPPAAWDALEQELATKPRSLKPVRYIYYLGATAVLLSGLAVTKSIFRNHDNNIAASLNTAQVTPYTNPARMQPAGTNTNYILNAPGNGAPKNEAKNNITDNAQKTNQPDNNPTNTPSIAGVARTINHESRKKGIARKQPTALSAALKQANTGSAKVNGSMDEAGTPEFNNNQAPGNPGNEMDSKDDQSIGGKSNLEGQVGYIAPRATIDSTPTPAQQLAAWQKQSQAQKHKADSVATAKKNVAQQAVVHFNRFEAGIKGGYERGFNNNAAQKAVISPYVQYNFTEKLAVMIQPGFKYSSFNLGNIAAPRSYYKEHNDSSKQATGTDTIYNGMDGLPLLYYTDFTYTQSHDSIVKSYSFAGKYFELELPIMLKYAVSKKVSVYGGANIAWSKVVGIQENTYTQNILISKYDTTITEVGRVVQSPPVNQVITYKGNPYSNYTGSPYPVVSGTLLRLGYTLGFSYQFSGHWLFDGLVQQGFTRTNMVGGYNMNEPLSAPYFRITLGYKLF